MRYDKEIKNFKYLTDVDYHRCYNCDVEGCGMICRCSTLEDLQVESVDLTSIVDGLVKRPKCPKEIIINYCVDRILTHHKLYDPGLYEAGTEWGYYGQELGQVTLDSSVEKSCQKDLDALNSCNTINSMIEFVIKLEYESILDRLKNKNWSVQSIDHKLLQVGNNEYLTKKVDVIDRYKTSILPIGLAIQEGKHYLLMDGYHRYLAAKQNNKRKLSIIVGKSK